MGARFSAPIQTSSEAHSASYAVGTSSISCGKFGRVVVTDQQFPPSAWIENGYSCTSTYPMCLLRVWRDTFTFNCLSNKWTDKTCLQIIFTGQWFSLSVLPEKKKRTTRRGSHISVHPFPVDTPIWACFVGLEMWGDRHVMHSTHCPVSEDPWK